MAREGGGGGGGDGKTSVHAVSHNTSGMAIVSLYLSTLCTAQRLSCLRIIFLGCVEDSANNYLHEKFSSFLMGIRRLGN